MQVYRHTGVEPWQQGLQLASMEAMVFEQQHFNETDTFHTADGPKSRAEYRQWLAKQADELDNQLRQRLQQLLGASTDMQTIDLEQVVDNFRWGRELGTLKDGSCHPLADRIEQAFGGHDMRGKLTGWLKSDWLRDDRLQFSQPEPGQIESHVDELLALINQGRAVLNNGIVDTLLTTGDDGLGKTAGSQITQKA
ncbi:MAG: hypothetical protein OIF57_19975 [Marinobacterium sp.]|nr:hypothetical protein [Marinobacterium sp.]